MPHIQIIGPSRQDMMMEEVGRSIGQGLGNFATNYLANKSLQNVLSDPNLKDAPLSEKQSRLQQALQPYGEVGENILQKRMAIAQQQSAEQLMAKAKKAAANPNATPSDILFSLIEGAQGIPGSERFIGSAFQTLMQQRQNKAALGEIPELPEEKVKKKPLPEFNIPQKQTTSPVAPLEQPSIAPQRQAESGIGEDKTGLMQVPGSQELPFKNAYISPQEYALRRTHELNSGGDGSVTDQHVRSINNAVKEGRALAQEDRDWIVQNQEMERAREKRINEYIAPKLQAEYGKIEPLEATRAEQYAKEIDADDIKNGIVNTPADLYEKTRERMNNYLTYKGRLEGTPVEKMRTGLYGPERYQEMKGGIKERPIILNIQNPKDNALLDSAAEQARPLILMGEDDEVRRILAKKGYYSDEAEDIIERALNPEWKAQREKFSRSIPRPSPSKETEFIRGATAEEVQERRTKDIDNLYKGLSENITPSSSLITLWREAEHKGYTSEEFMEALTKLRRNGFKLYPRQIRDLPEVNKPTMTFMRKIFG